MFSHPGKSVRDSGSEQEEQRPALCGCSPRRAGGELGAHAAHGHGHGHGHRHVTPCGKVSVQTRSSGKRDHGAASSDTVTACEENDSGHLDI